MAGDNKNPDTQEAYPYARAWNYVLWLLGRRAYTLAQLREKLRKKEATAETIEQVARRLEELKLVDDRAYAEMYVQSRRHRKGRIALRRELVRKGVPEPLIEAALAPLETEGQIEAALTVLEKEAWRFTKDDPRKNAAKAFAFLARRGFTSDVAKEALERSTLNQGED
ncbi:MAG TPA: regulatory protein RecX [Trueperaceae bacterium]